MKMRMFYGIILIMALSGSISLAQKNDSKITVSGYVMDASCKPVAGALVLVDSKNTAVTTDDNGYYKVKVGHDANLIGVLVQGNEVRSEFIDNRTEINFSLKDLVVPFNNDPHHRDPEKAVDVGISEIPAHTAVVMDRSKNKNCPYSNIYEMIQGKVAGVYVRGQTISMRGNSSISGDNSPLLVVDGVIVESIDHIMPVNVQTITFLKGASAAIYGSRGLNGVIAISLKKGAE